MYCKLRSRKDCSAGKGGGDEEDEEEEEERWIKKKMEEEGKETNKLHMVSKILRICTVIYTAVVVARSTGR
jgi:hypothetical protein